MRKLEFNLLASEALYRKHPYVIAPKQCYQNVMKLSLCYPEKLVSGEWRVCYGYMDGGTEGLLIQHCFILDKDGRVLDPTIFAARKAVREHWGIDGSGLPKFYYEMHTYGEYGDYLRALTLEQKYALEKTLREKEELAAEWAAKEGFLLMGSPINFLKYYEGGVYQRNGSTGEKTGA